MLSLHWALALVTVSPLKLFKNYSFPIVWWVSWTQAHCLSALGVLGVHLLGGSLKSWAPDVASKPLASLGKLGIVRFHLIVCCGAGVGLYGKTVSLQCGVFFSFTSCVGAAQLVSEFLSEGIVSCIFIDLVCLWEELSSGSSCVTILNLKIPRIYFLVDFLNLRK